VQNHPAHQEPRRVLGSFFAPKSQNTPTWEQRKLGELSRSFEYGLNAAAKEYDGQNKYLRITDIDDTSRQFVSADITSPDANLAEADNYRLSDGDVLFARTGASVGKTYLYKKSDGLVYFAGFLIRAKIKESVSAGFIFQNTLTRSYERYIAITSQRSGQPGVNAQEYAEYQLMLPELFEQEKIAKLLEALDILITLHQREHIKSILEVKLVKRNE
jgi:type I restriction enzyme S subunit